MNSAYRRDLPVRNLAQVLIGKIQTHAAMHAPNLVHEANLTSADALPELDAQKLPLRHSAIGFVRRGPIRHFAQPIINRTKNRVKKLFLVARLEMEQRIAEIK